MKISPLRQDRASRRHAWHDVADDAVARAVLPGPGVSSSQGQSLPSKAGSGLHKWNGAVRAENAPDQGARRRLLWLPEYRFWHMLLFVLVTGIAGWYGVYQAIVWIAELLRL